MASDWSSILEHLRRKRDRQAAALNDTQQAILDLEHLIQQSRAPQLPLTPPKGRKD